MALVMAYSGDVGASNQQLLDSGWTADGSWKADEAATHHPLAGYGGCARVFKSSTNEGSLHTIVSPLWPGAALSDVIVQAHVKQYTTIYHQWSVLLRIYAADRTTILAEARPSSSVSAPTTLKVYSANGSDVLTLQGTTTATAPWNSWWVLAIRFKNGASGEVEVSIDGTSAFSASPTHSTKTAQAWGSQNGYFTVPFYLAHVTVWGNPATDNALTVTKWVATLKPSATAAAGSFTATGAATLHEATDDDTISASEYGESTTDPDEMRCNVEVDDVDAAWAPSNIDGVVVVGSVRGDGALSSARSVIKSVATSEYGAATTTDADSNHNVVSVHTTDPNTAIAWTKAGIDAAEIGVEVT